MLYLFGCGLFLISIQFTKEFNITNGIISEIDLSGISYTAVNISNSSSTWYYNSTLSNTANIYAVVSTLLAPSPSTPHTLSPLHSLSIHSTHSPSAHSLPLHSTHSLHPHQLIPHRHSQLHFIDHLLSGILF
jgi:hypothetical protein